MAGELVRDWMHQGVITCHPETPVAEVADTMASKDISALVVVNDSGDAVGVISRTDLVNARFIQPYLKHWVGMTAEHLMTKGVISIGPEATIEEAARKIQEQKIHRLVVTEQGSDRARPIGILSVTDLARHVGET
jgi:CBS domain-containing protein